MCVGGWGHGSGPSWTCPSWQCVGLAGLGLGPSGPEQQGLGWLASPAAGLGLVAPKPSGLCVGNGVHVAGLAQLWLDSVQCVCAYFGT